LLTYSGNVIIKLNIIGKFFIETPKFVVLRGFHTSEMKAPQGVRDPPHGNEGISMRRISFAALRLRVSLSRIFSHVPVSDLGQ